MNLLKKLFFNNGKEEAIRLKTEMMKEKKKDVEDLKKINKAFRLLISEKSVEITIKNVSRIMKELK